MRMLSSWVLDKADGDCLCGSPVAIDFYGLNDDEKLGRTLRSLKEDIELGLSLLRRRWLSVGPIVEEILREADAIIEDFPNIERNGTVLEVRGNVGMYDIDIVDGTVALRCLGGHKEFSDACFCLRGEGAAGIDSLPGHNSKRMLSIALNLASHDNHLLGRVPLLRDLAMCSECLDEGRIGEEISELAEKSPRVSERHREVPTIANWDSLERFTSPFGKEEVFEDLVRKAYEIQGKRLKRT
ncbi:MAG: hypothetical protein ACE5KV_05995 [Thermoplasmata archaeon]